MLPFLLLLLLLQILTTRHIFPSQKKSQKPSTTTTSLWTHSSSSLLQRMRTIYSPSIKRPTSYSWQLAQRVVLHTCFHSFCLRKHRKVFIKRQREKRVVLLLSGLSIIFIPKIPRCLTYPVTFPFFFSEKHT